MSTDCQIYVENLSALIKNQQNVELLLQENDFMNEGQFRPRVHVQTHGIFHMRIGKELMIFFKF